MLFALTKIKIYFFIQNENLEKALNVGINKKTRESPGFNIYSVCIII